MKLSRSPADNSRVNTGRVVLCLLASISVACTAGCGGGGPEITPETSDARIKVVVTSNWTERVKRVERAVERASRRQVEWADCLPRSVGRRFGHPGREVCAVSFKPGQPEEMWWVERRRGRVLQVGRVSLQQDWVMNEWVMNEWWLAPP